MVQTCSKCAVEKELSEYVWDNRYNRPKKKCKSCDAATYKAWRLANKEKVLARNKKYREDNPDFRASVYEKASRNQSKYQSKRNASEGRRRATKMSATPPWLSEEQLQEIKDIYWLAKDLKAVTGEDYHVDHIHPLSKGGLHVPWNLQILPSDMNLRKSNKMETNLCL